MHTNTNQIKSNAVLRDMTKGTPCIFDAPVGFFGAFAQSRKAPITSIMDPELEPSWGASPYLSIQIARRPTQSPA